MPFVVELREDLAAELAGDFRVFELHVPLEAGVGGEHFRALAALDVLLAVPLGHVVGDVALSDALAAVLATYPLLALRVGVDRVELFDVLLPQDVVGKCLGAMLAPGQEHTVVKLLHVVPVLDERLEGAQVSTLNVGAPEKQGGLL